jgi:hypothetical protein
MQDAVKQKALDFSKINKEPPSLYRRTKGTGSQQQKRELRAKLSETTERLASRTAAARARLEVQYGDDFIEALKVFDAPGAE